MEAKKMFGVFVLRKDGTGYAIPGTNRAIIEKFGGDTTPPEDAIFVSDIDDDAARAIENLLDGSKALADTGYVIGQQFRLLSVLNDLAQEQDKSKVRQAIGFLDCLLIKAG